jgi:transcriptional regulator with XRE-family HTH domain
MEKYTAAEKQFLILMGRKIKKTRKARGLIQEQIAAMTKSEKANLSRIESGKTNSTVMTLKKIAEAMQVPVSDLITGHTQI